MTNEQKTRLSELAQNPEFATTLVSQESPEKAQEYLASNGINMTMEEVLELGKALNAMDTNSEELNEEALEDVAGGSLTVAWAIAKLVIAACGAALAAYKWYKSTR